MFLRTSTSPAKPLFCTSFEDKEAVLKMIVKGRNPAMRHVSRTHRVAFDWFLDVIKLEPMISRRHFRGLGWRKPP